MLQTEDYAKQNARGWLDTITELISILDGGEYEGEKLDSDAVRQLIWEGPLSIEVRDGWRSRGSVSEAEEYKILLTTGGPALRIIGELDQYNQPGNARLEYQDWGTPWTEFATTSEQDEAILTYAQQFYFGE